MAAAKKVAVKPLVAKPARKPRTSKDDGVYWVVSVREFLTWEPVFVHKTQAAAQEQASRLETEANTVLNKYKVTRVSLVA